MSSGIPANELSKAQIAALLLNPEFVAAIRILTSALLTLTNSQTSSGQRSGSVVEHQVASGNVRQRPTKTSRAQAYGLVDRHGEQFLAVLAKPVTRAEIVAAIGLKLGDVRSLIDHYTATGAIQISLRQRPGLKPIQELMRASTSSPCRAPTSNVAAGPGTSEHVMSHPGTSPSIRPEPPKEDAAAAYLRKMEARLAAEASAKQASKASEPPRRRLIADTLVYEGPLVAAFEAAAQDDLP